MNGKIIQEVVTPSGAYLTRCCTIRTVHTANAEGKATAKLYCPFTPLLVMYTPNVVDYPDGIYIGANGQMYTLYRGYSQTYVYSNNEIVITEINAPDDRPYVLTAFG